jgi:hypothetical protein
VKSDGAIIALLSICCQEAWPPSALIKRKAPMETEHFQATPITDHIPYGPTDSLVNHELLMHGSVTSHPTGWSARWVWWNVVNI